MCPLIKRHLRREEDLRVWERRRCVFLKCSKSLLGIPEWYILLWPGYKKATNYTFRSWEMTCSVFCNFATKIWVLGFFKSCFSLLVNLLFVLGGRRRKMRIQMSFWEKLSRWVVQEKNPDFCGDALSNGYQVGGRERYNTRGIFWNFSLRRIRETKRVDLLRECDCFYFLMRFSWRCATYDMRGNHFNQIEFCTWNTHKIALGTTTSSKIF